ncbi:early estrogen-induced gene 1 protein-like isoform X1 [Branchiostoma lanceolatum]|uniref:early estrogen-induced gene 1 protein-like isoform X1 n=1 Tax=Branchiostoma lanceolatum TaxID=7740 RepID=UPI00345592A9
MMTFMAKKKKYKFHVDLELEELSAVPFVNGILFSKLRLLEGGTFTELSSREEVSEHCVRWNNKFKFACKMMANAATGILDPCICRVSVRKEVKGGKTFTKLGFVDVNLGEFAGSGITSRRYLLEGYDSKHRQDNSILKVNIAMTLLSGDPCFKAPDMKQMVLPGERMDVSLQLDCKADDGGGSLASGSSGFGSLPRKNRPSVLTSGLVSPSSDEHEQSPVSEDVFEMGHSRNSSYASQQSKASDYSSTHSRSSSYTEPGHFRNPSHSSSGQYSSSSSLPETCASGDTVTAETTGVTPKAPVRRVGDRLLLTVCRQQHDIKHKEANQQRRVDDTRVDADDVVNQILESQDFSADMSTEDDEGLRLFVAKDGTTALSSHELKNRISAGAFEAVIFENR